MKITKEVKAFAEREFNAKLEKARNEFYAPIEAREEEVGKEFEKLIESLNSQIREFGAQYPNFRFRVSDSYSVDAGFNTNHIYASSVTMQDHPKFENAPDKMKFMAELSMGESLDEITKMLEKYFA